jgi:hypothetical protein
MMPRIVSQLHLPTTATEQQLRSLAFSRQSLPGTVGRRAASLDSHPGGAQSLSRPLFTVPPPSPRGIAAAQAAAAAAVGVAPPPSPARHRALPPPSPLMKKQMQRASQTLYSSATAPVTAGTSGLLGSTSGAASSTSVSRVPSSPARLGLGARQSQGLESTPENVVTDPFRDESWGLSGRLGPRPAVLPSAMEMDPLGIGLHMGFNNAGTDPLGFNLGRTSGSRAPGMMMGLGSGSGSDSSRVGTGGALEPSLGTGGSVIPASPGSHRAAGGPLGGTSAMGSPALLTAGSLIDPLATFGGYPSPSVPPSPSRRLAREDSHTTSIDPLATFEVPPPGMFSPARTGKHHTGASGSTALESAATFDNPYPPPRSPGGRASLASLQQQGSLLASLDFSAAVAASLPPSAVRSPVFFPTQSTPFPSAPLPLLGGAPTPTFGPGVPPPSPRSHPNLGGFSRMLMGGQGQGVSGAGGGGLDGAGAFLLDKGSTPGSPAMGPMSPPSIELDSLLPEEYTDRWVGGWVGGWDVEFTDS